MKIKIKGVQWEIVEQGNGDNVYIDPEGKSRIGLCDAVTCTIYVHEGQIEQHKRQTLIHELTHAFIFEYALGRKSYNDEDICDYIAVYGEDILLIADRYFNER